MADLTDWDDRSKEKSTQVREGDIRYVIHCSQCSVYPLLLVPDPFKVRAGKVVKNHNAENPGHTARLTPRGRTR